MSCLTPDERWKRFNKQLQEQMRQNDFYGLGITYYKMAGFLFSDIILYRFLNFFRFEYE